MTSAEATLDHPLFWPNNRKFWFITEVIVMSSMSLADLQCLFVMVILSPVCALCRSARRCSSGSTRLTMHRLRSVVRFTIQTSSRFARFYSVVVILQHGVHEYTQFRSCQIVILDLRCSYHIILEIPVRVFVFAPAEIQKRFCARLKGRTTWGKLMPPPPKAGPEGWASPLWHNKVSPRMGVASRCYSGPIYLQSCFGRPFMFGDCRVFCTESVTIMTLASCFFEIWHSFPLSALVQC